MKAAPKDWPRITSGITCKDAVKMIDWYCKAFGFAVRIKVEDDVGHIKHSELTYDEGLIMVNQEEDTDPPRYGVLRKSPLSIGATTHYLMVYVDDVDAHCHQARAAGARITSEPQVHDYGEEYWADRSYGALDPEDHLWWFTQRLRSSGQ